MTCLAGVKLAVIKSFMDQQLDQQPTSKDTPAAEQRRGSVFKNDNEETHEVIREIILE